MRLVRRTVPAPDDLGIELVGVDPGTDLDLDLRLEAVMEGVLVSGTVHGRLSGECGRCLTTFADGVDVQVQELFVYPERVTSGDEGEEDLPEVQAGELVDLEPVVRDAVVTALPFQPLCSPDCPGLCPRCGARLADVEEPHVHDETDPRWAALRALAEGDRAEGPAGEVVDVGGVGGAEADGADAEGR